jgi:PAS domain-containing protein
VEQKPEPTKDGYTMSFSDEPRLASAPGASGTGSFCVSFQRSLLPILVADDRRRYVDANPAACLLLRLRRAQVLELRVDDLTPPENVQLMRQRGGGGGSSALARKPASTSS